MVKNKIKTTLIAFLSLFVIALIFYFSVQQTTFTSISISNVEVQDEGSKILVYATTGGGQALQIDFTPSKLNQYLEDKGYKATKSSTLKAEYIEQTLDFTFSTYETDNNAVKLLKDPKISGTVLGAQTCNIDRDCIKKGYPNSVVVIQEEKNIFLDNCKCVEYYNNGYVNSFTGLKKNGFKVRFNLDGEIKELTDDSQSISFSGGQAKINWQGSLLGINEIGTPGYDIFHIKSTWYLIDKNSYSNVNTAFVNFKSCVGTMGVTESKYDSCLAEYYNIVNNNIDPRDSDYKNRVSNVESISFSQGTAKLNLKQPTFKPTFTIELDAEKVGIIKLSGEPEITSCIKDVTFSEAGSDSASAKIKNIGNEEGYFDFKIECDNSAMQGYADGIGFNAGEEKTISFQLFGGNPLVDQTNSANCKLIVTDTNSKDSDTCNFDFDVEYKSGITECTTGETKCGGKLLFTCIDGLWNQETCPNNCGYVGNIAQCTKTSGGSGGKTLKPSDCSWYQEYTEEIDCGFLGWKRLTDTCTTVTKCKIASSIFWTILISVIVVILTIIFYIKRRF